MDEALGKVSKLTTPLFKKHPQIFFLVSLFFYASLKLVYSFLTHFPSFLCDTSLMISPWKLIQCSRCPPI